MNNKNISFEIFFYGIITIGDGMKKLIIFLITLLFIPSVYALSVEDVPITNYVNDYSNVLSDDLENYITEQSRRLELANGTQIVVVTYPSLEGEDLEDFTYDLGNYYKIGKDSKGLIIFLVTEDRNLRVEVGDNLEGILNDGKVGRYMDSYMIPYLRDNDWENAIRNGYNAFYNEIVNQEHLDLETISPERLSTTDEDNPIFIALMLSFAVALIGGSIGNGIKKLYLGDLVCTLLIGSPTYVAAYRDVSTIFPVLVLCIIPLILYFTIRFSSGSGGGSSSGGSSWSSGGGGFSGGGGGFSGGGGSFSGGGASRSF